ncbi:hypothetical protein PC128_g21519 [Phytophthora cactorum]|nr:hypothetical protein PC128_g21519 [Phytophthora cactorum]
MLFPDTDEAEEKDDLQDTANVGDKSTSCSSPSEIEQ